ncbi:MAG: hypothetical protein ACOYK9_05995 [Chlamydiia bacterium]
MSHKIALCYLEFMKQNPGKDPLEILQPIAEEFRLGADFSALQFQLNYLDATPEPYITMFCKNKKLSLDIQLKMGGLVEIDKQIGALKDGGYFLLNEVSEILGISHASFVVKWGKYLYHFDPNIGLMKFDRENLDQYISFLGSIAYLWYGNRPLIESLDPNLRARIGLLSCEPSPDEY